jgi:hypothetical protein
MIYTQRTKMCQIYYGDYGLGVKLLTLVRGYQHFIGTGSCHHQSGY